jgi:SAM-dependent methyltransferase
MSGACETEADSGRRGDGAFFSCVIDSDARFHLDALRWFATLTRAAEVPAQNLRVHAVGSSTSDVLEYLRSQRVEVRTVEPFDAQSPTCNKISAAMALASGAVPGRLYVLTDSDIAIAEDPAAAHRESGLAAKIVDAPNPPLAVLREVFAVAGLQLPAVIDTDLDHSDRTIAGNFNGGLYIVSGSVLPTLARAWEGWARWLLDRIALLGRHAFFVDQVAMAMAVAQEQVSTANLAREWNFPTHVLDWVAEDAEAPAVVHYHWRVEQTGLISATGSAAVDGVVATLNEAISSVWQEAFPNKTFWDWRYKSDAALGSGVGSRGAPLEEKRRVLREVVRRVDPASVLDVGCGDGEATRDLPLPDYTGLDISEEAIRLAGATRPDGRFYAATIADWPGTAELTICLDVLIHQSDIHVYRSTVAALLAATTRVLLISGYQNAPTSGSPMIHFHEPLSETIERSDESAQYFKLREEHEISTFAIVKPPFAENWPRRTDSSSRNESGPPLRGPDS